MKRIISGVIRFCLAITGMILMMCQTDDMDKQISLLFGGLLLFIVCVVPSIIHEVKIDEAD